MDYREFRTYREEKLVKDSGFVDAGDLDLYGKFPPAEDLFKEASGGHIGENIHRCHLVEDFLRVYGLDGKGAIAIDKRIVSYSRGVRQSLVVLMDLYKDKKWLIPSDNYPYYQNLANTLNIEYKLFDTLGESGFEKIKSVSTDANILLVTYPLKPSGRDYTKQDWNTLKSWLKKDASRKVIFDTVYLFDLSEEKELFQLFNETKQVVILYSLSKAFAAPMIAGFTFTFDNEIRESFKKIDRDEKFNAGMRLCYFLLNLEEGLARRDEIRGFLRNQKATAVSEGILPESFTGEGYLFYLPHGDFADLESKGILTVPPGVYSSPKDGVIISTLSL